MNNASKPQSQWRPQCSRPQRWRRDGELRQKAKEGLTGTHTLTSESREASALALVLMALASLALEGAEVSNQTLMVSTIGVERVAYSDWVSVCDFFFLSIF
eukprot:TRINITY_DN4926_c0_g1_i1.p3 TRINITY_DN4926_c0_g1~~TRINITY_DN4926_c0_g1_i1.p3  ORF type:complete len:101 (-),score=8.64 TRINITY_DN4926_c0_g1_i1:1062-1364(-)